jgi:hypothetical protein
MNIVFGKHIGSDKEFVWDANGLEKIEVDDIMIVNTKRGIAFARATSEIEECSNKIIPHITNKKDLCVVYKILSKDSLEYKAVWTAIKIADCSWQMPF